MIALDTYVRRATSGTTIACNLLYEPITRTECDSFENGGFIRIPDKRVIPEAISPGCAVIRLSIDVLNLLLRMVRRALVALTGIEPVLSALRGPTVAQRSSES